MTCEICNGTGASVASQLYGDLVSYCTCDAGLERFRRDFPIVASTSYTAALAAFGGDPSAFEVRSEGGELQVVPRASKYSDEEETR